MHHLNIAIDGTPRNACVQRASDARKKIPGVHTENEKQPEKACLSTRLFA
jgi:hypothetical protein